MTMSVRDSSSDSCRHSTGVVSVGALGSCGGLQRAHADQIVGGRGEEKLPVHASPSTMTELPEPTDGLHPPEDFFDAFAHALTDVIARVARRAPVQGAT